MWCTRCYYDLGSLRGSRCPECGRAFDPADHTTFRREPRGAYPRLLFKVATTCSIYGMGFGLCLAIAVVTAGPRLAFGLTAVAWPLTFAFGLLRIKRHTDNHEAEMNDLRGHAGELRCPTTHAASSASMTLCKRQTESWQSTERRCLNT